MKLQIYIKREPVKDHFMSFYNKLEVCSWGLQHYITKEKKCKYMDIYIEILSKINWLKRY